MDLAILAAMNTRDSWDRYSRFVKLPSLTEESATIFQAIGEWYKNNPNVLAMNWKAFSAWFCLVRHPKMDPAKLALLRGILSKLEAEIVDEEEIGPLLESLSQRDYAGQIAEVALRITDGDYNASFTDIQHLLGEYEKSSGKIDTIEKAIGEFSLERLDLVAGPGLQWRMPCLNEGAGDLRQGDFVIFGKRPDAGGTTWLSGEASFMAQQLGPDQCVLWFNNEEAGDKVRRRIVQAALGWTTEEMDGYIGEALEEYTMLMGGNRDKIKVFDQAKIWTSDVEQAIKRYNPGLIIFDQLWKVKGWHKESEVERQTLLANWARELSKEHAPVLAVHQLGGDAENVAYPTQDMLYGSKTGIQGEADLIIMLGRKVDKGSTRYISLPKNKMLTPGDKELRNGRWEVVIDTDRAMFV